MSESESQNIAPLNNGPIHQFSLICDDIRQEMGGKTSLMGLYDNHIVVPEVPFTLPRVCFYTRFVNIRGQYKFSFTIVAPNGDEKKVISDAAVEIPASASEGTFNVIASPFDVTVEGVYEVKIELQAVPAEGNEAEAPRTYSYKFAISNAQRLQAEYEAQIAIPEGVPAAEAQTPEPVAVPNEPDQTGPTV